MGWSNQSLTVLAWEKNPLSGEVIQSTQIKTLSPLPSPNPLSVLFKSYLITLVGFTTGEHFKSGVTSSKGTWLFILKRKKKVFDSLVRFHQVETTSIAFVFICRFLNFDRESPNWWHREKQCVVVPTWLQHSIILKLTQYSVWLS